MKATRWTRPDRRGPYHPDVEVADRSVPANDTIGYVCYLPTADSDGRYMLAILTRRWGGPFAVFFHATPTHAGHDLAEHVLWSGMQAAFKDAFLACLDAGIVPADHVLTERGALSRKGVDLVADIAASRLASARGKRAVRAAPHPTHEETHHVAKHEPRAKPEAEIFSRAPDQSQK